MTKLVSVAGGGELGIKMKLSAVAEDLDLPVVRYDPETYVGLYLRFEEQGATVMAFRSGKYNIAGAISIADLEASHRRFVGAIETLLNVDLPEAYNTLEVRNLVYAGGLGQDVDLPKVFDAIGGGDAEYGPEQFPSLDYRPPEGEGLFKIFSNGKVSLTGITDPDVIDDQFSELCRRLRAAGE